MTNKEPLPPRRGRNRVDHVHAKLERQIESGELAVGDRLPPENALAEKYGVSRPVIREAYARLVASGLVRTERGRGSFVEPPQTIQRMTLSPITSVDDLLAWQELRVAIEQEAARLAATRRSDDDLAEITRHHTAMVEASEVDSYGGEADTAFHIAIAAASHNPAILDAQKALSRHIKGWISAMIHVEPSSTSDRNAYRLSEHEAIVDAIRNRNPDAAAQAIRRHIENGRTRFLAGLSQRPPVNE